MKKILAIMLAVMMIAVMAVGCAQPEPEAPAEPTGDVAMQYMTADEAAAVVGDPAYLFLDVRKAADYDAAHITGSVSADMDAAKNGDAEAGKATMTAATEGVDATIILVCYSGKAYAQASTNALSAIGYDMSKVFTLEGGFNNWKEAKADLIDPAPAASAPAEEEEPPVASGDCGA
ncbi:MAG: rhodanese-like domain-containing protein [Clostridia bacterium]|nr:rhodanese-like domain-containing protein [Clostridia bacterium]